MRMVVVGDSLGLPRPHRMNNYNPNETELAVHYKHTYSSIIAKEWKESSIEVINRSQRFYTIKDIYNQFADHLFFYEPDVIVLQAGIVDCWFREQLNGRQMVPILEFEGYVNKIIELMKLRPKVKMIIVGICPTSMKMEKQYPGILKEIIEYNKIYRGVSDNCQIFYLDMEKYIQPDNPHQYLLPDDHHLNREGNRLVATELSLFLKAFYENVLGSYAYNENKIQESYKHFQASYQAIPYYEDNLYNFLIILHQLEKKEELQELISKIESRFNIKDMEVIELIATIKSNF